MAIARLLLFFVVVISEHYASTPPNVRPPTEQLREQRGAERGLSFFNTVGRVRIIRVARRRPSSPRLER